LLRINNKFILLGLLIPIAVGCSPNTITEEIASSASTNQDNNIATVENVPITSTPQDNEEAIIEITYSYHETEEYDTQIINIDHTFAYNLHWTQIELGHGGRIIYFDDAYNENEQNGTELLIITFDTDVYNIELFSGRRFCYDLQIAKNLDFISSISTDEILALVDLTRSHEISFVRFFDANDNEYIYAIELTPGENEVSQISYFRFHRAIEEIYLDRSPIRYGENLNNNSNSIITIGYAHHFSFWLLIDYKIAQDENSIIHFDYHKATNRGDWEFDNTKTLIINFSTAVYNVELFSGATNNNQNFQLKESIGFIGDLTYNQELLINHFFSSESMNPVTAIYFVDDTGNEHWYAIMFIDACIYGNIGRTIKLEYWAFES